MDGSVERAPQHQTAPPPAEKQLAERPTGTAPASGRLARKAIGVAAGRAGNRALSRAVARHSSAAPRVGPLPGPAGTRPLPAPVATVGSTRPSPSTSSPPSTVAERIAPALAPLLRLSGHGTSGPTAASDEPDLNGFGRHLTGLGTGEALGRELRAPYERAYGYDLEPVRLHRGEGVDRATAAIGAPAAALGDHLLLHSSVGALTSRAGQFVLGHELAHVVQSRNGQGPGGISDPAGFEEREATAASRAALRGDRFEIAGRAGDDPHRLVWWVLALAGLAAGGGIAAMAPSTEENADEQVRDGRGTAESVMAWVPIAGSVQDIWQAESELQRAFGVGFLAFDLATIGGAGVVVRALVRLPGSGARTAARGLLGRAASHDVATTAAGELVERGGQLIARESAEQTIAGALSRQGSVVLAVEGAAHSVTYANIGGVIHRIQGGPLRLLHPVRKLGRSSVAGDVAARSASGLQAFAVIDDATPLTFEAIERLGMGSAIGDIAAAIIRNLFGRPTSCGIVQGAVIDAAGLSAETAARLMPHGAGGRFLPITFFDHMLESGVGHLVEGQTLRFLAATAGQGVFVSAQLGVRAAGSPYARNEAMEDEEGD